MTHRLNPTIPQTDHLLAAGRNVRLMRHHDDGSAGSVERIEEIHDLHRCRRIEVASRFVRKNDMGVVHQRAGDCHPLLLSAGQLIRAMAESAGKPDKLSQTHAQVLRARPLGPLVGQRNHDVFNHAQLLDEVI